MNIPGCQNIIMYVLNLRESYRPATAYVLSVLMAPPPHRPTTQDVVLNSRLFTRYVIILIKMSAPVVIHNLHP